MLKDIKLKLQLLYNDKSISKLIMRKAKLLYNNGNCQILTCSKKQFDFLLDDEYKDFYLTISLVNSKIETKCSCKPIDGYCHHEIAALLELVDFLQKENAVVDSGKAYTRKGMIQRVLNERKSRAELENYKIEFSDNIYGEHELTNEKGWKYKLTFRDIKKEKGYCSCPDYQTNKLGTCKHLMAAFTKLKRNKKQNFIKNQEYPFIEVFLDPLNDYKISWYYPEKIPVKINKIIKKYFGKKKVINDRKTGDILNFIEETNNIKIVKIRPEVQKKVEDFFEQQLISNLRNKYVLDFSKINAKVFTYQKKGISYATFRKNAIIADEMGLGKTLQAIGTAVFKKDLFGFTKTIIICPASLKDQWRKEINRFSNEKSIVIEGLPDERKRLYKETNAFFYILNYETVLRDIESLKKFNPDFVILDEAQRIKNYETLTANTIKRIPKKHALVITGTPIENKLIDLFSIMQFLNSKLLSPLWEFSYQHCYFDMKKKNKITGYYNLQNLQKRLKSVLIRREKKEVIKQLPNVHQLDIPVKMHHKQAEYHSSYARGIFKIIHKKFLTQYDMQQLMMLLSKMRMVCDSTYLIDNETDHSPKLEELKHILFEKLDIINSSNKIVIFSEWISMNQIIGRMLRENDIGYVALNSKVPVKKRPSLIKEFEDNSKCRIFLSTEAGGTGLNLQVADTVINFELPWNPAKKNQRIGRIDRIGQRSKHLAVINFITLNSIEMKIADGLLLKQDLFDGVLSNNSNIDIVDFSNKNRPQFLKQLENVIDEFITIPKSVDEDEKNDIDEIENDIDEIEIDEIDEIDELEDEEMNDDSILNFSKTENDENDENDEVEKKISDHKNEINNSVEESKHEEDTQKESIDETTLKQKEKPDKQINRSEPEQLEQVMNQGMNFLSGLMQMATGNELKIENNSINVNKETGEITMKFKLPGFN